MVNLVFMMGDEIDGEDFKYRKIRLGYWVIKNKGGVYYY